MKFGVLAITLGLFALLAFRWVGSSVDEQGVLREPFALLPIGIALLIVGVLTVAISQFRRRHTTTTGPNSRPDLP